jgi:hypothetical protein
MRRTLLFLVPLLMMTSTVGADPASIDGDKVLDGMSIVGNDEAPKSLVIVPWKSSGLVHTLDVSSVLGAGREPVDRDVFLRELDYYQIREASRDAAGAATP